MKEVFKSTYSGSGGGDCECECMCLCDCDQFDAYWMASPAGQTEAMGLFVFDIQVPDP